MRPLFFRPWMAIAGTAAMAIASIVPIGAQRGASTGCRVSGRAESGGVPLPGVSIAVRAGDTCDCVHVDRRRRQLRRLASSWHVYARRDADGVQRARTDDHAVGRRELRRRDAPGVDDRATRLSSIGCDQLRRGVLSERATFASAEGGRTGCQRTRLWSAPRQASRHFKASMRRRSADRRATRHPRNRTPQRASSCRRASRPTHQPTPSRSTEIPRASIAV